MADTSVFSRLRRLFSTDVVIRNVGGNQIKTIDTDHIQSSGQYETNALVDRFNRIYTTQPSSLYGAQFNLNYQWLRTQLYSEYDVMDQDAIIASALDILSDESTLKNDMGEVLQIRSSNEDIQKILYNLFYDVLNIEFIPYTAYHIERIEGQNPDNPSEIKYRWNPEGFAGSSYGYYSLPNQVEGDNAGITYDNYEMAHFRMVSDVNYLPYGRAYIEPARKLFKQYTLMEDAMLIHRIARAPEKRIFYVNVGAIPPNEVEAFMQKTISNMKRTPYMDEKTGEYNLKYNMQNMLEDFYIPVRGNDSATKIDTTPGLSYDGIQDVEYLRDKLFAALKIPKAFLGYDENVEGKATLAAEDIRFARTIDRIQRIVLSELNKIALVHLYTQGYTAENMTNFELSMTTPSIIYDQERIELLKSKSELAQSLLDQGLVPSDWIYHNIYHFSEDQYDEYRDLVREDAKRKFRIAQIEAEGNDPVQSGKSYGTPHDLASLYGKGRMYSEPGNVPEPEKYNKDNLGRPVDGITNRGKQENNFGKDPLGVKRMKDTDKNEGSKPISEFESAKVTYLKNKDIFKSLNKKKLIFEEDKDDSKLLDDSQLKSK